LSLTAKAHAQRPTVATCGFLDDVLGGLAARPKTLASKYLYDARGSALFEQICDTPEYYLTRAELALMRESVAAIAAALGPQVRLVEFGNGSGVKTRLLLAALEAPAAYVPVEISATALAASSTDLQRDFPALKIQPLEADFTARLLLPAPPRELRRTVVYLAGSTLGNFADADAISLLQRMRHVAGAGGALLLGLDLKKDPQLINAAYNDAAGITSQFTLNLLQRINRELAGDFRLDQFRHRACYEPVAGRIETDIVSTCRQRVHVASRSFEFAADEAMRVEISCKYDRADIERMAGAAGLRLAQSWADAAGQFAVVLLRPVNAQM
jgi:dimethylhistidine N-methyltransferase